MSGRIWPGALCYITHPTMFGRMVEALQVAPGAEFRLPDGYAHQGNPPGFWVTKALSQPFSAPREDGTRRFTQYAVIEGRWLRPLTPPPAADEALTEDTAPCDEPVHPAFG